MIVSAFISVHALRKQERSRKRQSSQDSLTHWTLDAALIGRMPEGGERIVTEDGG